MSNCSFNKECPENKIRVADWSTTAFHLLLGYVILTAFLSAYLCTVRFTSLGQLLRIDANNMAKGWLISCLPIYIIYSCYVIGHQVVNLLYCRYLSIRGILSITYRFLNDYVWIFYVCYIPFLCFCTSQFYDYVSSYVRLAKLTKLSEPDNTEPFSLTLPSLHTLITDVFFQCGIQLSLYLIPLLFLIYVVSLIYKKIWHVNDINMVLSDDVAIESSTCCRKSLREIIRSRIIVIRDDVFWWIATFVFWVSTIVLIAILYLRISKMMETSINKPLEPSAPVMSAMGGAILYEMSYNFIMFVICALVFYIIVHNIIYCLYDCITFVFFRQKTLPTAFDKLRVYTWFPYILWTSVVICFCLCIFIIGMLVQS